MAETGAVQCQTKPVVAINKDGLIGIESPQNPAKSHFNFCARQFGQILQVEFSLMNQSVHDIYLLKCFPEIAPDQTQIESFRRSLF